MDATDFLFGPAPVAWVQRVLAPGFTGLAQGVGELGTNWGILLAAAVALWLFGRRTLYALLAVAAVEGLARRLLSDGLGVARPDHPSIVVREEIHGSASFPSGHVSTATVLWTWLALAARVPLAAAVLVATVVSVSRLYLGVHWMGDVLGAVVLGAGLAAAWLVAAPRRRRWTRSWPFGAWLALAALGAGGAVAAIVLRSGGGRYLWNAAAFVAGAAAALPAEWRWVRYAPSPGRKDRVRTTAVGAAGFLPLFALHVLAVVAWPPARASLLLLATLWCLLFTPWLAVRRGWGASDRGEPGTRRSGDRGGPDGRDRGGPDGGDRGRSDPGEREGSDRGGTER